MSGAIYARLSTDDGESTSIERQIEAARQLAQAKGIEIEYVYSEHVSGFLKVERPQYEQMLKDIEAGLVDHVFIFKLDRLTRRPKVLEAFLELVTEKDLGFYSVHDALDTGTVSGRAMLRVSGVFSSMESENTSLRVRAQRQAAALSGVPAGGKRMFGYQDDKITIHEEEAALIREGVDRALKGESLNGIARDWNKRGYTSVNGNPFRTSNLRQILTRYRNAGIREYKGEPVAKAIWEPIISEEQLDQVKAILDSRGRKYGVDNRVSRVFLLKGILLCGGCGNPLTGAYKSKRSPRYICHKEPGTTKCGTITITCHSVDEYIWGLISTHASKHDLSQFYEDKDLEGMLKTLSTLEAKAEEAAHDYYVEGSVPKAAYESVSATLNTKIKETREKIERTTAGSLAKELVSIDLDEAWETKSIIWKAQVARLFVAKVIVNKGTRGAFDPSRLNITMR